jgi:hypothetical protein
MRLTVSAQCCPHSVSRHRAASVCRRLTIASRRSRRCAEHRARSHILLGVLRLAEEAAGAPKTRTPSSPYSAPDAVRCLQSGQRMLPMFHSLLWTRSTLYNETTNLDQHQATSVATQAEYKEQYHHSAICLPLLVLRTDLHGHICKPSRPSLPFQSRFATQ